VKGSAASLGAERLVDLCARTQKMTDAEMARRPDLVSSIREEFEQARAAFDRYIEERRRTVG
jgi:HPt (histidine-containing phosphotransfer) domain-containing protein